MRKFILLIISAILLLTACSDEPQCSSKVELNYRKITKCVYTKYDPHKFDGISAPKIYAGEYEFIDPDAWCELFNSKPEIKKDNSKPDEIEFETETECGYLYVPAEQSYPAASYGQKNNSLYLVALHYFNDPSPVQKDLDFMPISEVSDKFLYDIKKYISTDINYIVYPITKDDFTAVSSSEKFPDSETNWTAPEDFYFIEARQAADGIEVFTGALNHTGEYRCGCKIEAIYSRRGIEYLNISFPYKFNEEIAPENEFIEFADAEKIVANKMDEQLGHEDVVIEDAALRYVSIWNGDKFIMYPTWEFYYEFMDGVTADEMYSHPLYRINAFTGEDITW